MLAACCLTLSAAGGAATSGPRGTIAFSSGPDLWMITADGKRRTRLTGGGTGRAPSWSADARHVVFEGWRERSLQVLRLADGRVRTLPLPVRNAAARDPDWSRDGRIAFVLWTGGLTLRPAGIFVANADGSGVRQVVDQRGSEPDWSPDGSRIAFVDNLGERRVAVVGAEGGAVTRIASGGAPNWSPDGTRLAYVSAGGLTVANADGSDARVVFQPQCGVGAPTWSPDGRWLAVAMYPSCPFDGRYPELFVVPSAGGAPIRIGGARYGVTSPDWAPVEPSTGTVLDVRLSTGACAQRPGRAVIRTTDRQGRPLARSRVVVRARNGRRVSGVTGSAGTATILLSQLASRLGRLVLAVTVSPTDRPPTTTRLSLPPCA